MDTSNKLIFFVTGNGEDPHGTQSTLFMRYEGGPDYIVLFIKWLNTPNGRVATDDGLITIEVSPDPGRIYVNGQITDNDLTKFFLTITDLRKIILPLLSINGGVDEFNAFTKTVIWADNEWDINFQTTIKYLVARYNHQGLIQALFHSD